MKLEELLQILEEIAENDPPMRNAQVMIATQPSWPMEQEIGVPVAVDASDEDEAQRSVVYIPVDANASNDYLHGAAKEELGW